MPIEVDRRLSWQERELANIVDYMTSLARLVDDVGADVQVYYVVGPQLRQDIDLRISESIRTAAD